MHLAAGGGDGLRTAALREPRSFKLGRKFAAPSKPPKPTPQLRTPQMLPYDLMVIGSGPGGTRGHSKRKSGQTRCSD